ncbi:MAG TPA: hypothetical protein VFX17_04035 [Patescibacteria group bacterium]|nr:hypothetical protein [Patescibacteria group bacterium]
MNKRNIIITIIVLVIIIGAGFLVFKYKNNNSAHRADNTDTSLVTFPYSITETNDQKIAENNTNSWLPYTYTPWGMSFNVFPQSSVVLANGSLEITATGTPTFALGILYNSNTLPNNTDVEQLLLHSNNKQYSLTLDANSTTDTNTTIVGNKALHVVDFPANRPGLDDYYFIYNNHLYWIQGTRQNADTTQDSRYATFLNSISFTK